MKVGLAQRVQQARQSGKNHGLAAGRSRRVAIVQQQDVAWAQAARESLQDTIGLGVDGVKRAAGPGGELQIELAQHRIEQADCAGLRWDERTGVPGQ